MRNTCASGHSIRGGKFGCSSGGVPRQPRFIDFLPFRIRACTSPRDSAYRTHATRDTYARYASLQSSSESSKHSLQPPRIAILHGTKLPLGYTRGGRGVRRNVRWRGTVRRHDCLALRGGMVRQPKPMQGDSPELTQPL